MQQNHGLNAESGHGGRLAMMAALWNELAASHNCAGFEEEFRSELAHLEHFRSNNPQASPKALISDLEATVIDAFRERFRREGILALRARLNRSN